jgi:hypothetical protein
VGMLVRSQMPSGQAHEVTFSIPWSVDLTVFGRQPPVGVWRLWKCPPHRIDPYDDRPTLSHQGDSLPDSWWYDAIPF